jgi:hypothetical protein
VTWKERDLEITLRLKENIDKIVQESSYLYEKTSKAGKHYTYWGWVVYTVLESTRRNLLDRMELSNTPNLIYKQVRINGCDYKQKNKIQHWIG